MRKNNRWSAVRFLRAAWVYLVLLALLLILFFLLLVSNERSADIDRTLDKDRVSSDQ